MKKNFLLLVLIFSFHSLYAEGFKHPGGLHTQADFDRIKAGLATNDPAVVQGYENLKANPYSSSTTVTYPVETIVRGGSSGQNYINAARGAAMAYQNALRWKISGEEAHARKAVEILNAWAAVCKRVSGDTNLSLASGLYGYAFANAAELMRDYPGWNPDDFEKFKTWMLTVWYPPCIDFLKRRHDTWSQGRPGHYWSNWGLCNVLGIMSIGILCDDVFIYNQGLSYYKYDYVGTFTPQKTPPVINDGLNEFLGNLVPVIHPDSRGPYGYLGQMQESGRDQGHTLMAVGLAVDICQIGWNQGDDLFAHMDNRLAAGIEYVAAYNSEALEADQLPWSEYWYHDVRTAIHNSWKQTEMNAGGRGQHRPFWDRIVGHYEGIKGVSMTYSRIMRDRIGPDFGGSGSTSGGYDHLGFSTLTCTRPPVTRDQAPTTVIPQIVYNGTAYDRGELTGVLPGSTVQLIPQLPAGEINTGNWSWNTGIATKDLTVMVDESALYRVTYINSNGVKSTQLFSIAVYGDCTPALLTPYISSKDISLQDTIITVLANSSVTMTVTPSAGGGTYQWSGVSSLNNSITVENVASNCTYSVIYTNEGGATTRKIFHINIYPISPSVSVEGESPILTGTPLVVKGNRVELIPVVEPGKEGGTWKWSNGSALPTLVLNDVRETQRYRVTYTLNGVEYSLDFNVYVLPFEGAWAYWPLNEGSGTKGTDVWSGYEGQLQPEAAWNDGIVQTGVKLDGKADSYLQLPDDIIRELTDYSIAVWVKLDEVQNWTRIWDFGSGTSTNMFLTPRHGSSGNAVRFAIKKDDGGERQINSSSQMPVGQWTHLTVTKSGNIGVLYMNGVETGRNTDMNLGPSDLGELTRNYIGKSQYADPMLKGTVDELRIYSKALTPEEIKDLYDKKDFPATPTNLSVSLGNNGAELSWNVVPNAAYNVRRASVSGGPYTVIATGITSDRFTDESATDGLYYYTVSAVENYVEGDLSNEEFAATYGLPAPVRQVAGVPFGSTSIKLYWEASPTEEHVTEYIIERALTSEGPYTLIASEVSGNEFSDNVPDAETVYYYKIYAVNFFGKSEAAELRVSSLSVTLPGVPFGIKSDPGPEMISIHWDPVLEAEAYNVKRSETSGGPYVIIASNVTGPVYLDNNVTSGKDYFYVISAVNTVGESDNSTEIKARTAESAWCYYPLDETSGTVAEDLWNGRNGTLQGSETWTSGMLQGGFRCDGSASSYVKLPNEALNGLVDFTVAAWVKLDDKGNWARVWDFGNGTSNYLFLSTNNGNVTGPVRYSIKNGGSEQQINSQYVLNVGEWTHIVVTQSQNRGVMYINGEIVAENNAMSITPRDLGGMTQNYIGKSQWSADAMLKGIVDDIRIYNKALEPEEVNAVFALGCPGAPILSSTAVSNNKALLSWNTGLGSEQTYTVSRSNLPGGPYVEIADGVAGNSYMDKNLIPGTYYYVITAVSSTGFRSEYSNEVFVSVSNESTIAYWSKTPEDHNWNNPNNWTDESGNPLHSVPFACTNVHIPGNSSIYPDLSESHTPRHLYGDPVCNEITFRFGSEVAKQNYLTYGKAYVQYNFGYYQGNTNIYRTDGDPHSAEPMKRNRWYALSAPLNKIVSGDFSVGGYPNFWQQGFKTSRGYSGELIGDWYSPSNTNVMSPGDHGHYGISVWAARMQPFIGENNHSNLNALKGILEMPYFENSAVSELHRIHDYEEGWSSFKYYYYDLPGLDLVPESVRAYDRISRGEEAYRFVTDDRDKWTSVAGVPAFKMEVPSGAEIMIGNPFLSSLDFGLFYEANRDRLEEYFRLYEVPWNTYVPGLSPSSGLIPSFQAFFVKTTGTPGETTELYFPESASVSRSGDFVLKRSVSEGAVLYAEAYGPDETVGKALIVSEGKSVKNIPQLFIDSENDPEAARAPQLYFLGEEGSKNVLLNAGESTFEKTIKLGLASTCTGDITLKFDNVRTFAPSGLYLKDTYAGNTIDLTTANTYTFRHDPSVCDRFELSFGESGMLSGLGDNARESSAVIRTEGRLLYVSSGEPLSSIRVYTVQGTAVLTDENPETQWVRRLNVPEGVYLVKITYPNHKVKTEKVVVN